MSVFRRRVAARASACRRSAGTPIGRAGRSPLGALLLALVLGALAAPAGARTLPMWKVTTGGHVLYLVGSMHALRPGDYPLPAAMRSAFHESDRLIEEIDLVATSPASAAAAIMARGRLPQGTTLSAAMDGDWRQALTLAGRAHIDLVPYAHMQPWLAAIVVADRLVMAAGYDPALGLDRHFAALAQARHMPVAGLETLQEQIGLLASLPAGLQRKFLLQTLAEAKDSPAELARLHAAWRSGDTARLAAIERADFAGYPGLRGRLLDRRNRAWIPALRRCLGGADTCFVVVGVEHMAGPEGLPALLRAAGYRVIQAGAGGAPGR